MHPAAERVLFDRELLIATLTAGGRAGGRRGPGARRLRLPLLRVRRARRGRRAVAARVAARVRVHARARRRRRAAGVGYRASLQQRGRSRQVQAQRDFRVEDYTLAMDCVWRGEPLYAAQFPLSDFFSVFSDYDVFDRLVAQAASSLETSCAAAFVRADFPESWMLFESPFPEASCFAALSASLYVLRSDGAVACLGAGVTSTGGVIQRTNTTTNAADTRWRRTRMSCTSGSMKRTTPAHSCSLNSRRARCSSRTQ